MIMTSCLRCHKLIRLSAPNWIADDGGTRCPDGDGNVYAFHIPPMKFLILEQVWSEMQNTDRETGDRSTKQDYMRAILHSFQAEIPGAGRHHPEG